MTQSTFSWNHAPTVAEGDVDRLIDALRHKGWLTAKQLRDFGTDRQLRAWASASQGRIISGQLGYRLTLEASAEEVNEFIGRMASQETEMKRRRLETERVWHLRRAA